MTKTVSLALVLFALAAPAAYAAHAAPHEGAAREGARPAARFAPIEASELAALELAAVPTSELAAARGALRAAEDDDDVTDYAIPAMIAIGALFLAFVLF